ncbi:filamin-A-interacting protein 1-like isoform X2 [Tachysurus fulvidraco]|uniref:filamin-A-interacting protein 1-like isoform X1 n=1 Tax=Tachysurus fulvidraco TaxID=1234273 RepID=UPI001FEE6EF0|nr:filamin-A-interacting protein 1-like isoform X1 [Tachysurus fulvidraco]XP_027006588.2 filamin-A-interacting protein 1-like isoform X2 [Tachysurus fulvidraco]
MSGSQVIREFNRSFTTTSEEELELDLEDLSGQESASFSMLMNELNREIDRSAVFGVTDPQEILSNKLKPLMKNVLTESYYVQHLSEHLRQKELQMPRDQDEVHICRISTEPSLQLSETDTMRLQLYDLEQRLVRAEEEKMKLCTELQEKVCASENMVQSLQLELSFSQRSIQLLSYNLLQSADSVQSLNVELKAKEEKIQLLEQRLLSAQESTKLIQKDLDVSKDLSHTFQQQLSTTVEQNRVLQEALMACEARVQEAEKEKQRGVKAKEKCEKKIRNTKLVLKALNKQLELVQDKLEGELKMSLEREDNLKMTIEKATANHKAEVKQLQHSLYLAKVEAREMEMNLRNDIIDLKQKLGDKHAYLDGELKKSLKKEMKFEETVKKLTLTERLLPCDMPVKETDRENPWKVLNNILYVDKINKDLHERMDNRLWSTKADLQMRLKVSGEEKLENLKRMRKNIKAKKAEIEPLNSLHKAKEEATDTEGRLTTDTSQGKLIDENTTMIRGLKKSLKHEGKLEEKIKNLRHQLIKEAQYPLLDCLGMNQQNVTKDHLRWRKNCPWG